MRSFLFVHSVRGWWNDIKWSNTQRKENNNFCWYDDDDEKYVRNIYISFVYSVVEWSRNHKSRMPEWQKQTEIKDRNYGRNQPDPIQLTVSDLAYKTKYSLLHFCQCGLWITFGMRVLRSSSNAWIIMNTILVCLLFVTAHFVVCMRGAPAQANIPHTFLCILLIRININLLGILIK